jgi:hypothetical protein
VNYMKRAKEEYISAVNGLEALHKYQSEHQNIKAIFMGMNSILLKYFNVPITLGSLRRFRMFQ